MSPELIQKGIAITLITGGIGGGYFALVKSGEGTLSEKHLADGRELVTDWNTVSEEYIKAEDQDLIEGVNKGQKVAEKLQKWCEKYGNTYYLGATDQTYRSYYTWCLQKVNIDKELTKQKFKWEENRWEVKLKKYQDNNAGFILNEEKKPKDKAKVTVEDIKSWCTDNKVSKYKYLGDNTEYQMRLYCYWTDEELEEAKKSPKPKRASD